LVLERRFRSRICARLVIARGGPKRDVESTISRKWRSTVPKLETRTDSRTKSPPPRGLQKSRTGIQGLDEITRGGLPKGRTTLVSGSAGCGKTLLSIEFLVRGAQEFGEPGVFMAFEETADDLAKNVASLGFDLEDLIANRKLRIDHVHVERSEIEETGEYDLEGLFIRLGHAIDTIGAKRVVLDTLETLFGGLSNEAILRAELRRLFRFLESKGVTAIVTAERGGGTLTRHGLEEYVSDCVILLDHRVSEQVTTRRLRVVKYRGTMHGTNEYPFLIDENGISVLPISSLGLDHRVSNERVTSGIPRLDTMLGGAGFYRGTSILITGTAGTGKSTFAARFAAATCERGERCLYFAFEESKDQIVRNQRSVGLDLEPPIRKHLLRIVPARPTLHGLEMHVATLHREVNRFDPAVVILDPVSNLSAVGGDAEVNSALMRIVDFLKGRGITALFTNLTTGNRALEHTEVGISSLIDTWILLRDIEIGGERNRGLFVLKSRGMGHSNQIREFILSDRGIELLDVYTGPSGVLTGSARRALEAQERDAEEQRRIEVSKRQRELERKRALLEAKIVALRREFEAEEAEASRESGEEKARRDRARDERAAMASSRRADAAPANGKSTGRGSRR
jgi:circadian clock protein KaiC